jgi:hypothetical protein
VTSPPSPGQEMKQLGDSYARAEFKAHKSAKVGQVCALRIENSHTWHVMRHACKDRRVSSSFCPPLCASPQLWANSRSPSPLPPVLGIVGSMDSCELTRGILPLAPSPSSGEAVCCAMEGIRGHARDPGAVPSPSAEQQPC